eukprot:s663_g3.t1
MCAEPADQTTTDSSFFKIRFKKEPHIDTEAAFTFNPHWLREELVLALVLISRYQQCFGFLASSDAGTVCRRRLLTMRRLLFAAFCFSARAVEVEETKQPTAQDAEEFQQDFLDFDLNKDKQIDAQEVRTQFKGELDPKELHQFFIDVDQDLSGTISLQEYISYASSLHSDQPA